MNSLLHRLAWLRRRLVLVVGARGLFAVWALLLGAGLAAGLLDWARELPNLVRAFLLATILIGAAYLAYRLLLQPLFAPRDDLSLALRVEGEFPQLNDCLASTVQFLRQSADTPNVGSQAMRDRAVAQATQQSEGCDFGRILDRRGAFIAFAAFLLSGAAVAYYGYHYPDYSLTAAKRLADPFGNHTWTRVTMEAPHRVAVERPFAYQARIEGLIPKGAKVQVADQKKIEELVIEEDDDGAFVMVKIPRTKEEGVFRYRVLAGDGSYPRAPGAWHEVQVLPPPSITSFQAVLDFPAYTEEASANVTPLASVPVDLRHLHFVPGTVVRIEAETDRPLASAWIEYHPRFDSDKKEEAVRSIAVAGLFGAPGGLEGLPLAAGEFSVFGRFPARFLDDNSQKIAFDLLPWASGKYRLHLTDNDGLERDYVNEINLEFDSVPTVRLRVDSPHVPWDKAITQLDVSPDAELDFLITASEEKYSLRDVFLEFTRPGREAEHPLIVRIFDHAEMGRILPSLMAGLAAAPPAGDLKIRWQRLEQIPAHWALANRFKPGEIVSLRAGAHDFCDVFFNRAPGRSDEIKLRIVAVKDLLKAEEEALPDAQVQIEEARAKMENALDLLKKVKNSKQFEDVARAIEDQRTAKARLEKLLEDVNKQTMTRKINKLPFSEPGDLMRTVREELEALVDNDLPELEDQLHKAAAKVAGLDRDPDKAKDTEGKDKDGKDKGVKDKDDPLAKATDLQAKATNTLKDLSRLLDPFASLQMMKAKAKDLLLKQEGIRAATDKLQKFKDKLDRGEIPEREKRRAEKEFADEIESTANAQRDLGSKAEDLLKMLEEAAKKREAQKDDLNAGKLKKAFDIGSRAKVPEKMRDAGADLKKKNPLLHETIQEQDKIKTALSKLNDALNDKKLTEDVDRLTKKRKDTNENLDKIEKLREDLEGFKGKVGKAMKIKDAKERAAEMDKIGKEREKIKKDLDEAARELAKLNEPRAAKALEEAAKELDKAGEKMKAGADPGENIDAAMDKLNDANDNLQEEQDQLAREQLAQIADLIKGLKERQDEAIVRGDELQKRVMERKIWSEGLLDTLSGAITTQDGLAKEVKGLTEKLKDAIVFEHIMEKAAKAMERAAEDMGKRKEIAKERQIDAMLKEELDDETKRHADVARNQKLASARLNRLLEAVKDEQPVARKDPPKKDGEKKDMPPPKDGDQPKDAGAGDAIPPIAQLKALKAEQMEIRDRTKDFDSRFPDRDRLVPDAERELRELQDDQLRIHQLFERMTTPAAKKGA